MFRAIVARLGLGTNLPEDSIYPVTRLDAEDKPLTGANRYAIVFRRAAPAGRRVLSLTLYNSKQAFVDNPINRYAIGDRDPLKFDADGSLTLYVQHDSPGKDKESNWLPAPKDEFNLVLRLYWPKKESSTAPGRCQRWNGSSRRPESILEYIEHVPGEVHSRPASMVDKP